MSRLSPWVGRLAALALLIAVVGGGAAVVIVPVVSYSARLDTQIEQNADLAARLEALTAAREDFEQQIEFLNSQRAEDSVYLPGRSDGVASANLQKLVRTVVDAQGGDLKSTQSLDSRREGDFERVTVRIVLEASTAALFGVLYDLETRIPYVFIENFDIRTQRRRSRKQEEAEEDPLLMVRFDLYGYLKGLAG
jgi:hypothetical protein